QLPTDWWTDDVEPLRDLGDQWIRAAYSLAIEVPSAALRMEWNVLINPLHPKIGELKIEPPQPFHFDARMFR
ncbi:MAG: RES family NAD+ phosphorylase, partial [Terracidiphilus sp.]